MLRRAKSRMGFAAAAAAAAAKMSRAQQALSQRLNLEGIAAGAAVVSGHGNPRLALPHLAVPDLRSVDWCRLRSLGFRGVVFDKDNTLTAPFALHLWPSLSHSLSLCKSAFLPRNLLVFSNSAGLFHYDPDGSKARSLEESLGIPVLRHGAKKPGGTAEEIEKYFGCPASSLVMVGDRILTDIVYGNRHGFFTILTEPLSLTEEPFVVKQVRKVESYLVRNWYKKGLKPLPHHLLPGGAEECIKDPMLLKT